MSEFRAFLLVITAPVWGPAMMFYGVGCALVKMAIQCVSVNTRRWRKTKISPSLKVEIEN